jgi:hypothetical protein
MSTTPPRPQSPLRDLAETERLLHQYETIGLCGRFTNFFVRNIALIVLLIVSLIALSAWFPETAALLMPQKSCQIHHDEILGKMWLECPGVLRRAFGPRRY